MPGFNTHLLAGALVGLFFQNNPPIAIAVVAGSIFPDVDSRESITHHGLLISLGVLSMAVLYPYGLLLSIITTLSITCAFLLLLPKHRQWLHKLWGQLLFGTTCFLITFDPMVALAGILGTTIHRLLDRV